MNLTIGCDPELFLFDNLEQRIVPAVGKIGGSKQKPLKLSKGTVQLDGTAIEIGTHPASSGEEFADNIQSVISEVTTKLDNRFHGRYSLRCGALAGYDERDIDPNHEAFDVGCEPHYSFDSGNRLVKVGGADKLDMRQVPVGGHIHVGFGCDMSTTDRRLIVSVARFVDVLHRNFPVVTNVPSLLREDMMSGGQPVVRVKPYGFEYRNPDSYWLSSREATVKIYDLLVEVAATLTSATDHRYYMLEARSELLGEMHKIRNHTQRLPSKYQSTLPLDF